MEETKPYNAGGIPQAAPGVMTDPAGVAQDLVDAVLRDRAKAMPTPPDPATTPKWTPAPPSAMNVSALHATLKAQSESAKMIEDYVREKLRPGEDFGIAHDSKRCRDLSWQAWGRCPSCHRKPDLWLPGAERVLWILGCTMTDPAIARDLMDAMKGEGWIAFRVSVVSRATGEVLGYGLGARRLAQDGNDPNKCLKMAAKSALIDAVKRTFALSGFFTQDGGESGDEDAKARPGRGRAGAATPGGDAAPAGPAPQPGPGTATAATEVPAPVASVAPAPVPAPGDEAWVDRVREKLGLSWDWIYALLRCAGATWNGTAHVVSADDWAIVRTWLTDELRPKLKKNWTADQKEVAAKLWIREWTGWDGTAPTRAAEN